MNEGISRERGIPGIEDARPPDCHEPDGAGASEVERDMPGGVGGLEGYASLQQDGPERNVCLARLTGLHG